MNNSQIEASLPLDSNSSIPVAEVHRSGVADAEHPLSLSLPTGSTTRIGNNSNLEHATEEQSVPSHPPLRSIGIADLLNRRSNSNVESNIIEESTAQTGTMQQSSAVQEDNGNDARNVRRNMLMAAWSGFTLLTKGRKWILILRMLIGLIQLVVGIVILSLPTSLGDSRSTPETCDPEGMFVFLTLHLVRVFFSVPIDVYLGLSPHRTPRARRVGADGLMEREQTRTVGSLTLDRKLSRFSDLLGLCHIVLFIVGNYIVWTSLECSHAPAESRPLWIVCVCMLGITYIIILEVALMIFLVVFFLPLLIAILRALGLANRLPQRGIHPETGKIDQGTIDGQSRLVYFTMAKEEGETLLQTSRGALASSLEDLQRFYGAEQGRQSTEAVASSDIDALATPLPLSRTATAQSMPQSEPSSRTPRKKRLGLLFGYGRKGKERKGDDGGKIVDGRKTEESRDQRAKLKYPLYPIPAHRATCPICLCDFEEVGLNRRAEEQPQSGIAVNSHEQIPATQEQGQEEDVEPLRLLQCGHVMHMSCVDQWLTTVSGRCPVCQKPIISSGETTTST